MVEHSCGGARLWVEHSSRRGATTTSMACEGGGFNRVGSSTSDSFPRITTRDSHRPSRIAGNNHTRALELYEENL